MAEIIRVIQNESQIRGVGVFLSASTPTARAVPRTDNRLLLVVPVHFGTTGYWRTAGGLSKAVDRWDPLGIDTFLARLLARPWFGPIDWFVFVPADASAADDGGVTAGDGTATVTTTYKHDNADNFTRQWVAATGGDSDERDLVMFYDGVEVERAQDVAVGDVNDGLTGTYFVLSGSGATAMPAVDASPVAMSGGDSGTALSTEYATAQAKASSLPDIEGVAVLGTPDDEIADTKTSWATWRTSSGSGRKFCIVDSPDNDDDAAAAVTWIGSGNPRGLIIPTRRLTCNLLGANAVEGAAIETARLIQAVDKWDAPMMAVLQGLTPHVVDIGGDPSFDDLADLSEAGFLVWDNTRRFGITIRDSRTAAIVGGRVESVESWRYESYVVLTIADINEGYAGQPLNIDLDGKRLGEFAGPQGAAVAFLAQEEAAGRLIPGIDEVTGLSTPAWQLLVFEVTTPADLANDRVRQRLRGRKASTGRQFVVDFSVGTTVDFEVID